MEHKNEILTPLLSNVVIFMAGFLSCFRRHFIDIGSLSALKTFTFLSNLFLTITSLLSIIFYLISLKKKEDITPLWMLVLKLASITSTTLTFLTVLFVLWPGTNFNTNRMFGSSVIFLHLFTPIVGVLSFLLFEINKKFRLTLPLFSIIPVMIYASIYLINVFAGGDANVSTNDFYCFAHAQNSSTIDYLRAAICLISMFAGTLLISYSIALANNFIYKKKK